LGKALGSVFKIITSPLSLIDKDLGRTVSGIAITAIGIATLNPALIGVGMGRLNGGGPKVSLAAIDRLTLSLDPSAYRTSVFGETAMATDVRFERPSGTDQRYIDYIICVACHRVEAIDEIWLDGKKAWSTAGGYEAWTIVGGVNRLTVAVRLEGTAGNAINIGGAWNGSARLTGCAYVHIRVDRQGAKKTDSPFANGLPSAMRIIGKGWPLYDPRLDSTRGGSGTHRADNQATWGTATGRDNTALQILNHMIGWRINGALSVGKGVPLDDLDFASFITEANHCDEAVALAGGGTQARYRSAGVGSEGDDLTLAGLLAACNGEEIDVRGRIGIRCAKNDLAVPIASFKTQNILGPVRRSTGNVTETPNVIRGRYTNPSANALYNLVDIPEVRVAGTHAVERVLPFDLPFVQDGIRAQRILKQVLQRAQYQDTWESEYDLTALKCRAHDVVEQDFEPRGMVGALYRVRRQQFSSTGRIAQTFRVEHSSIYAWSAEEATVVSPAAATTFDPLNAGAILAAVEAAAAADAAQATNSVNLYRVEAAGVTSSKVFAGAGAGSEVAFGHANGSLLASAPASDPVAHIILADNGVAVGDQISVSGEVSFTDTGSTMALRVRFVDAAGAQVGIQTLTGIAGSATWTKMLAPALTVPAGAVALHVVNRTNGGTGTAGIRNVMVNRGPICAPYVAPTRGADVTETAYAAMVSAAAAYSGATTYSKGKLAKSQNAVWCYINATAGSGNAPPTLPTVSNSYWELVGSQGLFTWIAYSNAADGSTDFTTGAPGTRLYVGIAPNKTTSTESTNPADYQWKKWEGAPAVIVSPPSQAYTIACDSGGNPKAGEFNKVTTFAVLQGTVDLSNDADTDYSVANTNCSATMGGTNGKVLTQTAMSAATAKSVVTIQRSGVTVATVDVSLTKALEGAAARRTLDTSVSAPSSTSYGAANAGTLEMALDTGETANVSFAATYTATSAGTFFVSARIEYREKGSGTWLLLDSEEAGSAATYLGDPGDVSIFADLVGSGGLKVYEFQLLLKRSSTGPTMSWNPGNFLVSVF
jgi:hypothetical protein